MFNYLQSVNFNRCTFIHLLKFYFSCQLKLQLFVWALSYKATVKMHVNKGSFNNLESNYRFCLQYQFDLLTEYEAKILSHTSFKYLKQYSGITLSTKLHTI